MSLEELQADFAENAKTVAQLDPSLTSTTDLVNLIKFTLWPFLENVVGELREIDGEVQNMVDGIEDVLHQETAGVIVAPIIAARAIIAQYKATLPETATAELKAIRQWEKMAREAEETIGEIVVMDAPEEAEEEEPEDPDDEGDEDDEDDDDTTEGK